MQKLMSVPWGPVNVLRYVQISLEASFVAVSMDTSWMLTTRPATVRRDVCVCVCVCTSVCVCVCVCVMHVPTLLWIPLSHMFGAAIDSCGANAGSCDQICINTNGSYNCSCFLGFSQSGNTCIGKCWQTTEFVYAHLIHIYTK